jgi:hypothetical protein
MPMERGEVLWRAYEMNVAQVRYIETRLWTTFGNYLTVNSILLLAWATFYKDGGPKGSEVASGVVMLVLAVLGYFSGIAWAILCSRNYQYSYEYETEERQLEQADGFLGKDEPWLLSGKADKLHKRWTGFWTISHTPALIVWMPLGFSLLYLVLAEIVFFALGGIEAAFVGLIVAALGLGAMRAVAKQCRKAHAAAKDDREKREKPATGATTAK